jgi:hypothetical protein
MKPAQEVPLRDRIQWAERAARTVIRVPSLYSVVIEHAATHDGGDTAECGFQHERRSWLGRALLDVCQVRVGERPESAEVTSHGTFRANQYRQMAAVKEFPFPPRPLDLSELAVEPADARARMRRHVQLDGSASEVEPQCLGLILTICDGRLAWQGTVDVPEVGIHTVILAATTGHVLFHKFDQYHLG